MNRHTSSCVCQEATKLTSESNSFGEQLVQLGAMFSLFTRIRHRQRCQQLLRVGILRVIHNLIGITMFHNLALMHHHNAIGQHIDHGKIMGDAKPISACSFLNSSNTFACTDTSNAEVGSSAISRLGLSASARAKEAR